MNFKTLSEYPDYEIYKDGTVIRKSHKSIGKYQLKRSKITAYVCKNGYISVALHDKNGNKKTFYLHRLVWEAFNGRIPKGLDVAHEDCDRANCELDNLRLRSHSSNCRNPKSLERYRMANSLDKGKFNREKMKAAQTEKREDELEELYKAILREKGKITITEFIKRGHCNYYRAARIMGQMSDNAENKGVSVI